MSPELLPLCLLCLHRIARSPAPVPSHANAIYQLSSSLYRRFIRPWLLSTIIYSIKLSLLRAIHNTRSRCLFSALGFSIVFLCVQSFGYLSFAFVAPALPVFESGRKCVCLLGTSWNAACTRCCECFQYERATNGWFVILVFAVRARSRTPQRSMCVVHIIQQEAHAIHRLVDNKIALRTSVL